MRPVYGLLYEAVLRVVMLGDAGWVMVLRSATRSWDE
jgi:hypothetical protein